MVMAMPLPASPSFLRLSLGRVTLTPASKTPGAFFLRPRTSSTETVPAVASSTAAVRASATWASTCERLAPSVASAACTEGLRLCSASERVASSSISRP
jgi:hypothetical protein